ncbi:hypothetical protein [Chryseobacterium sp. Leaf394]|uniref:hypothetical protein n=1 Tax=Chryseobacterium sp. Leaf394 TaxID=1736361 RepID=UPI0006F6F25E|nr:hypothetical protein [Chryseobacterium sp. Leaf394]KQS92114.1 hypothetical protein ASG21_06595 [Chryseobacterium sp. Leaf394]
MESFETIQNKLLRAISESADREKIVRLWKFWNDETTDFSVSEPVSFYDSERPMTDEEVDEYFKEEVVVLPANLMNMIERGMDDVKNGKVYTEEEIDKMDEEWLK